MVLEYFEVEANEIVASKETETKTPNSFKYYE